LVNGVGVAARFDSSVISRIQQSNDITEVVSEHLSLQKKGKELVGLCPFHDDHRPSMYVNPAKQIFKCFACGAGGDVFKFVQLRENLTFPEAVERLGQRVGIKLEPYRVSKPKGSGTGGRSVDAKQLARVNSWAQKFWQRNLCSEQKGKEARNYIRQRQISVEALKQWCLGLALDKWDDLVTAAGKEKISEKLLVECGLAVTNESGGCYDKFRNRLMFPIFDVTDRVIGFGGRTLGGDGAKYMNSPATVLFDKSNSLYGLDKARHEIVSSGTVVVVEGYTDVIMAHQFGCKNVVATLGTSFTDGHGRILRRYAKRIVLVFDNDTAGVEAANRALEVCLAQRIDIKLAFVSENKDPCDFLLSAGKEGFDEVVENAVDVMEFKWQRLLDGLSDSDNITDKRLATEEFLRSVAAAIRGGRLDAIAKGLIVTKLGGIIGLSSEQINRELVRLMGQLGRTASYNIENQKVVSMDIGEGFFAKAQQEILEVLLNEPQLYSEAVEKVTTEDFEIPVLRQIAEVLFVRLAASQEITLAGLLRDIESEQAGSALVHLAEAGEKKGCYQKRLQDALEVFRNHSQNSQKDSIKAGLSDDDTESLRKITEILTAEQRKNRRNPGMKAVYLYMRI
jgi:DNA primase